MIRFTNTTVYKLVYIYSLDAKGKWVVFPYHIGGTIPYLGKRKWWYRSEKKAQRIADGRNGDKR